MLESLKLNSHDVANEQFSMATSLARHNQIKASSKQNELSDEALMMGYAKGNMQAFEKLYLRHKDALLRYFLRQTSIRATAEELFQETWQSLIRNSANYQTSAKFSTYLYRIAHSRLVDHYRKQGRVDWVALDESTDDKSATPIQLQSDDKTQPEKSYNKTESKQLLSASLDVLPLNQREVVILKFEKGFTVKEIAETLDVNAEAVKSRLRYALSKLKVFFESNDLPHSEFTSGENDE